MTVTPYGGHAVERVLGADPLELVVILYEELLSSILDARRHVAAEQPMERARSVSRALEILAELAQSVNPQASPELAGRLLSLYSFLTERLQQGNFEQRDEPLAECEQIVRTLLEGWRGAARQRYAPPPEMEAAALPGPLPAINVCG
ncbi:MAG: flagellar export chaperone FliS [Bryobacteraceae bacterium]